MNDAFAAPGTLFERGGIGEALSLEQLEDVRAHVVANGGADVLGVRVMRGLLRHGVPPRFGVAAHGKRQAAGRASPSRVHRYHSGVDLRELGWIATDAARAAGELLVERFRRPPAGVEAKSSATDLVSDADRDAETLIREHIRSARPGDAIIGEEHSDEEGETELRWVVDPLDGTVNFLFGIPHWCVSIAVEDARGGLVGVVHDPSRDETFTASRDAGAVLLGGPALAVSPKADLATALIATGFSYVPEERAAQAATLERVLPRVRDVRRSGSAALDLAWTAAGRYDGFYEVPIHHWDWAAGVVLVREAGGVVSDLAAVGPSGPGLVAAGPAMHGALRDLVS